MNSTEIATTRLPQQKGFYGWVLLPFLCLVYSLPIGFAYYGPPVIYQFMGKELGWQRGEINLGFTIMGLIFGMSAPITAWVMNRLGIRTTLAVGAVLAAVSAIFMAALAQIYPLYLVLSFFLGLGTAFGTVIPIQALVLYWYNARRALAMGLVLAGGALGGFIYPQIITAIITAFDGNWRIGWDVIAIICFLCAFIAFLTVRNRPEDMGQHPDGLSPEQEHAASLHKKHMRVRTYRSAINWKVLEALKTRSLWLMVCSVSFIYFTWQVVMTQTPFHLKDRGFISADPLIFMRPEFIYGLVILCSMLGRLSVSFLGEMIESRYLIAISGISMFIGVVLFWLAAPQTSWAALLFPLFVGFAFGTTYVTSPLMTGNYFGAASFPGISGITNTITSFFQFSAPFIAGLIFDINGSYAPVLIAGGAGAIIATLIIFFSTPPQPRLFTSNS